MGKQKYRGGFTIIEVILFLAVSGALAIGLFATSTVGINNQRYNDAVNSFKALVQEEFTNTTQVINFRQDGSACNDLSSANPVGASDCVVMGRLLTVSDTGEITRSNLVGKSDGTVANNDVDAIKSYHPTIDVASGQTSSLNWGTKVQRAETNQTVSVVIFRSPSSGNVLSFVKYTPAITDDASLTAFITADPSAFRNDQVRLICIDPSGWTLAQLQAVVITPRAAGPSGVEQRTVEASECN